MIRFLKHLKEKEETKAKLKHDREKLDLERRQAQEIARAKQVDFDKQRMDTEKKLRDKLTQEETDNPPEVGTNEIVKRYRKFIPGEQD